MLKVFLSSHAHLASGMQSALALFSASEDRLRVHDAYVEGEEATLQEDLDSFFSEVSPEDDVLLLSDLYGGSVNTVMAGYLDRPRTRLVAGVNLAFLIEVMAHTDLSEGQLEDIVLQAREALREVKVNAPGPVPANDPDDFF
ncbi:PTS sugar transporter subunit IIA domain-containing protein [Collinsella provencensis]|uniref:PTS sugar transporter subunit IIA domain-containing protein n=1 Tax=Collinsella provencensis TaxID=1937461 RepID=UPI000C860C60|nr:PTS sugar transporter subunit IIA [Collinsella provencensis]